MRIGYLGGSFDPVHLGHLALARACREGARLDRVVLVVAGRPPHKSERRLAAAEHRVAMARLAVGDDPQLAVDERETLRRGPSFTLETVRALKAERPGDELYWLIGGDTLPELPTWREVDALAGLVGFVIAARRGHDPEGELEGLPSSLRGRLRPVVVPMRPVDVSATEVRLRVREGRSVDDLVPEAVREYIEEKGLYRD
ncbi:MAG: nicotinate (nicotinamide) nucleotide adenylyltransferase [Planctomycetota bacterium]|jgi:nicotinate-nucleotide adenylyltransferase